MSEQVAPNKTNTRLTLLGVLGVSIIAAAVIFYSLFNRSARQPTETNVGPAIIEGTPLSGVIDITPPRSLQDFTLLNQHNQPTSLSSLKGKMALMLFGYTHCPDVCPLTLLEFKKIKKALGNQADQVNFVFISVDGERDTPAVLADYVARFDPTIIALSGDDATLTRVGTDYDLYYAKVAVVGGAADDYSVDHTSNTFLLDESGLLVGEYLFQTETGLVVADIQKRLNS